MQEDQNKEKAMPEAEQKQIFAAQIMAEQIYLTYGPPNGIMQQQAFPGMFAQMRETQKPPEKTEVWICTGCGSENNGKFCMNCGLKKPDASEPAVTVRAYTEADLPEMLEIWNEIVAAGDAFPQDELLDAESGAAFFAQQTYTGAAVCEGNICGLYILHPNNVGRCGHICNASFAVKRALRGKKIGEKLMRDCLKQARAQCFRIIQFNAVLEQNQAARKLYEKFGFTCLGTIEGGFRMPDGSYANICPYYREL